MEAARFFETSGHVIATLRENLKGRQSSFDHLLPVKTVYVFLPEKERHTMYSCSPYIVKVMS
jgi:hypothetical protein